jgi:ATP-dependent Lon protease
MSMSETVTLPAGVLPLLPMRNLVLFPHAVTPVGVGRPKSVAALLQAVGGAGLAMVLQRDATQDDPDRASLFDIGTLAQVVQHAATRDGQHHAMCKGVQRLRLEELVDGYPFLAARVTLIDEPSAESAETEALTLTLHQRVAEVLALLPGVPAEVAQALQGLREAAALADVVAGLLDIELAEKQQLLETIDITLRLNKLLDLVTRRIQVLRLQQEIGQRTKEQMDDRQRKYLLREQLKTIQHELGEDEGTDEEVARFEEVVAKAAMPADVESQVRKELARLGRMGDSSGEAPMLRTWLEWMTELPWAAPPTPAIDLETARAVLEADHHGLEKVKQRIIEYLAVLKLNPQGRAPILCFAGPPGVGKTSLGQSIARALGRPFTRVSLGGVHDEAELRGHRRTYIGALPGNIIQGIRRAGSRQGVMLLDEVDKLGTGPRGDPAAALLEVLDPEQNASFRDNYLGVPFDLSRVVFLATANQLEPIPHPVRDRMEVIELPGYTREEKLAIARRFLVQRQRDAAGLPSQAMQLDDDVLPTLIDDYTREAGVRQLEREIGRLMRHAAVTVAVQPLAQVRVAAGDLPAILGPARYEYESALRTSSPGVATGLAWTPVGGDILFVEATRVAGSGRLLLTGQLGDVMKESAQAALTLVKSRAGLLGIDAAAFEATDVHLHVPAGAIPKDGPSAGVAIFVALASLFANEAVRGDVAMTGEISLRGLVLPVGGVKEKVLAAQRAGLKCVLLPRRNQKDLADIPTSSQQALELMWMDDVDAALRAALGHVPAPPTPAPA